MMEEGSSAPGGGASTLRILIAEDEPSHARLLSHTLRSRGHHGDVVADGEALLRAVQADRYDVILIDLRLPRLGGLEAAAWIRGHHADDDRPLLIAVTAEPDARSAEWTREGGFDAHFKKPLDTRALLDELDRARPRRPLAASIAVR